MAGRGRKGHCPSHLGQHMLGTRHIVVDVFSWLLKEALNDFTNGFGEASKEVPAWSGGPNQAGCASSFCLLSHF